MRKALLSIAAILAIAGCAKENVNPFEVNTDKNDFKIIASVVEDSKTTLSIDGTVAHNQWSQNDEIAVLGETVFTYNHPAVDGKVFEAALKDGEVTSTPTAGAYPRDFASKGTEEGFKITIPSVIEDYEPGQTNVIMVAGTPTVDGSNYTFEFHQVAALLKFTINNVPVGAKTFVFTATGKKVSGEWDNVTSVSTISTSDDNEHNEIKLVLNSAVTVPNQDFDFYVPIPTGTYGKISIEFLDEDLNSIYKKTASSLGEIARRQVIVAPELNVFTATFANWNSVFGTTYNGSFNPTANNLSLSGTVDGVSLNVTNGTVTNGYVKDDDLRMYKDGYTMTISAPTGKKICSITSVVGGKSFTSTGLAANSGSLSVVDGNITWTGNANSVVFTPSATVSFKSITVKYNNSTNVQYTVTYDGNKPAESGDTVENLPDPETVDAGPYVLSSTKPTLAGYRFVGWGLTSDAVEVVENIDLTGDITVYAIWNVAGGEVTDVLTADLFAATSTSYTDFSNVKSTGTNTINSSAVYAGNTAKTNAGGIQLRSTSQSGIITTTSGGKVKSVTVNWATGNTNGRSIDIYGKTSAYESAADLYGSTNRGTKLGSITVGTSDPLSIDGDYDYIGIRSKSGALYVTSITIVYE